MKKTQDPQANLKYLKSQGTKAYFSTHFRKFFSHYPELGRIANFLVVGAIGFMSNLLILTGLLWVNFPIRLAVACGIASSTLVNFFFDRHLVFSYACYGRFIWQFLGFLLVCACGAVINYYISMALLWHFEWIIPQVAVIAGASAAILLNYISLRFIVFKR